jgi:hypothetical protein
MHVCLSLFERERGYRQTEMGGGGGGGGRHEGIKRYASVLRVKTLQCDMCVNMAMVCVNMPRIITLTHNAPCVCVCARASIHIHRKHTYNII